MLNIHYMNASRHLTSVINKLEQSLYSSSYMDGLLDELKRAHNEMQRAEGALPYYPEVDEC